MDAVERVKLGLLLLGAGNVAWTVTNAFHGLWVNVVTDVVIVVGCLLAALSLQNALDGIGPGRWRAGLLVIAVAHFMQNLLNTTDGLTFPDEWTLFAVMLAAIVLAIGAIQWRDDGWNPAPAQLLSLGMIGLALEPAYFLLRYVWTDPWASGYLPGELLVLAGTLLAAWGLRQGRFP